MSGSRIPFGGPGGGRGVVLRGGGGAPTMMGRGPMAPPGAGRGFAPPQPPHLQHQPCNQHPTRGGGQGPRGMMMPQQHGGGRFAAGGPGVGRGQPQGMMMPPRGGGRFGPVHPSAPIPPPPPPPMMAGRGGQMTNPRGGPMVPRGGRMMPHPPMQSQHRPPPTNGPPGGRMPMPVPMGRGAGPAMGPQHQPLPYSNAAPASRGPMLPPPPPPPPPSRILLGPPHQHGGLSQLSAPMGAALPPPPPPPPPPPHPRPAGYAQASSYHHQHLPGGPNPAVGFRGPIPPPPPPPPPRMPLRPGPAMSPPSPAPSAPHPSTAPAFLHPSHAPSAGAAHIGIAAAPLGVPPSAPQFAAAIAAPAPLAAVAPAPAPTAPVDANSAEAWTEHSAPNGMKYYYNSISKESTYLKPEVMKQRATGDGVSGLSTGSTESKTTATTTLAASARGPSSDTANTSAVATTAAGATVRQWREYVDASTGKKYYSDGITTTWDRPSELGDDAPSASAPVPASSSTVVAAKVEGGSGDIAGSPPRRNKRRRDVDTEFGSKDEAVAAFKGMLLAKDVSPSLKWNEVAKICAGDARWEACEGVLTLGERKQALAEYQTKRANDLREQERQERSRAKAAFTQMLSSVLPSTAGFSWYNSRFADVRDALTKDDRFHAVADEGTRESLFLDFCEEYRKREERKKRSKRADAQDAFLSFLKEKEDSGEISYASTWESFVASLPDTDTSDDRFIQLPERSDEDRQVYFADFVLELQAKEDDKRRRIRDARQRAEQEQRDAFREFLAELAVQGKLLPSSRWRIVEDVVSSHSTFAPVKAQDPDLPREIFEEFANGWNARYLRDRTFLSQLVYPSATADVLVKADTTLDEFTRALLDRASEEPSKYEATRAIINRDNPMSSARLYFNELSMRARGVPGPAYVRRGSSSRRGHDSDSSEDEGEIVEDGELILE